MNYNDYDYDVTLDYMSFFDFSTIVQLNRKGEKQVISS